MKGKRLDAAETKKAMDAAAAFNTRLKEQTAAEGSRGGGAALIGDIQTGKPNYDLMTESFAATTRQQLQQLQTTVQELDEMKSLKFKGVGPGGADIYEVTFAKGALDFRIWMADAAKVENAVMRKM